MELVDDSACGLYTIVGGWWSNASVPRAELTGDRAAIEYRVEGGVVVHLELAVELETAFPGEDLLP